MKARKRIQVYLKAFKLDKIFQVTNGRDREIVITSTLRTRTVLSEEYAHQIQSKELSAYLRMMLLDTMHDMLDDAIAQLNEVEENAQA